jgi:hypothetical protein
MIEFTIGAYVASVYTHAYLAYNNKFWEPIDKWDIAFFLLAPISYPICLLASLVNQNKDQE